MGELSQVPTSEGHKVVVIGLDGATLDLLRPLMQQGVMPNLKRILDSGCHGQLNSTLPPMTAPAWSSFLTGKNPGKHGVYDFRGRLSQGFTRLTNDSRSIRAQALWDILALHGKTIGMLNVPMTYPVPKVNGYAIAGLLSPRQDHTFASPPHLLPFITDDGPYTVDIEPGKYIEQGAIQEMLRDLLSVTKRRLLLATKLVTTFPVDLFMVVFVTPDRIQHTLWHILDPSHPLHDQKETRKHLPRIQECYNLVDQAIAQLVEAAGPSSATIVMSDHGFGQFTGHIDLEAWLRGRGLLHYRSGMKMARRMLMAGGLESLAWQAYKRLRPPSKSTGGLGGVRGSMIDWERTKAYLGDAAGYSLYLNVRGREPAGAIGSDEEYEQAICAIAGGLRELVDPRTGARVVKEAYRAAEAYVGPYVSDAPDILIAFEGGYKASRPHYSSRVFWPPRRDSWGTGCHRREGMIALAGPNVAARQEPIVADITDVAPTILYLLGLPIPNDIDGRVLAECLQPDLLSSRPPQTVEAAPGGSPPPAKERAYSEDEEQQVGERLRNLGYLD